MDTLDVLWACVWIISVKIGVRAGVDRLSAVDDLAELWAQLRVCCVSTGPQSVSANGRDGIVVKVSDACRMFLVDQITKQSQ